MRPNPVTSKYAELRDEFFQSCYKQVRQAIGDGVDGLIDAMIGVLQVSCAEPVKQGERTSARADVAQQNRRFSDKVGRLDDALVIAVR